MKKQQRIGRLSTLFVVALLLLIPGVGALATQLGLVSEKVSQFSVTELDGFWTKHPIPKLRVKKIFKGEFQQQFDDWFSSNFCARNLLVRLNNEILFDLFSRSYMFQNRIVVGRNNCLYQIDYLKSCFHKITFDEQDQIDSLVASLKQLQSELRRRKIAFVYVITPSKAKIWTNQLPHTDMTVESEGVYKALSRSLQDNGICFVDGHAITERLESTKFIQTFARGGAHWTEVAATATMNQVIYRINKQTNRQFPQIAMKEFSVGAPVNTEKDLVSLTNLMRSHLDYQVQHAVFIPARANWKPDGKIVFEGTSFVGQLTSVANQARTFASMRHYFYYTDNIYTFPAGASTGPIEIGSINWDEDILNANAIVMENNEGLSLKHNLRFVADILLHTQGSKLATKKSTNSL